MDNQKLAIHLIGEQIKNQVLMIALENLGFDCTMYTLNISEVILSLFGFEMTDDLFQQYFGMIETAVEETTYLNMDEMISKWSLVIYKQLIEIKSSDFFP